MAEKLSAKSAWKLNNALKKSAATKPTKVGTARVTRRDSDGSMWVRLPGSNVDTPVNGQVLSDAAVGDTVSVRIENGRLSLMGNATTPAVGQQQVNTTVQPVSRQATYAMQEAELATTYATEAQASAALADALAREAGESAYTANLAAEGALLGLSTVEDVVDTLTWITKHGTMTLTTDTAVDPSKVYFVSDASGQYVVGGGTYSIVQNPTTEGLSGYYELTIDKSVENYIATHVSVTNEGLWLTPTSSNGYRVLIATGAGTTYTTAGTYIIDNSGNVRAVIGEVITLGGTGESHALLDYHSLQLVDRDSYTYFHVSDLRNEDGSITETFEGDGATTGFKVMAAVSSVVLVNVDDVSASYTLQGTTFVLSSAPASGATVEICYVPTNTWKSLVKAYTFGIRKAGRVGLMSVAEGYNNTASGEYSHVEGMYATTSGFRAHAEGRATTASGNDSHAEGDGTQASGSFSHAEGLNSKATDSCSHAEGYNSTASGGFSHAQNEGTVAAYDSQTAIGKYNANDPNNAFEIGNGTDADHRSNALTVDWDGVVDCGGVAPKWATIDPSTFFSSMGSGWANDTSYTQLAYSPTLRRVVGRLRINSTAAHSAGNNTIGTVAAAYRPHIRALCCTTTTRTYKLYFDANGNATLALDTATTATQTEFYLVADYTMA